MSRESESRRAWIKNVAIIFLVVLLLLTFFSNTILNITLPEVSAQYAQYGTISSSIKVSGTVKANESYNVIYEADQAEAADGTVQSRKVVSVYVKEGETVAKDAPLLALQGGASDQLKAAQDEYDKLKKEYDLALLQDNVSGQTSNNTIAKAEQALTDQKKALAELKEEYNAALNGTDMTSVYEARIDALEDEIDALNDLKTEQEKKVAEVQGKIDAAEGLIEEDVLSTLTIAEKLAVAESDYATIEANYKTLTAEVEQYKAELDRIKGSSSDIEQANTLTKEIRSLEDQLSTLQKEYNRAYEDYLDSVDDIVGKYIDARNNAKDAYDTYVKNNPMYDLHTDASEEEETPDTPPTSTYDEATAYKLWEAWQDAEADLTRARRGDVDEIVDLTKAYDRAQEDREEQIDALETKISDAYDKLDIIGLPEVDDVIDYATTYELAEIQRKYDEANTSLTEVTTKYDEAKTKVESLRKQSTAEGVVSEYTLLLTTYKADLSNLEDQIKQKTKALEQANKDLGKVETPAKPDEIKKQIDTAEAAVRDLEAQLSITKANETLSGKTTEFERADQVKKLEELQKKIEQYKTAPENTDVTAPIAGRIVSIDVVPGDTVTSGNTVARIEIADRGYVCEISMASEEARKIQVGAECSLTNSWWYDDITASVTQIRSDPQSQGKNRIVVITVNGSVSEGQQLSFSIGDRNQSYDCVLPNSAIREDNDGKFVLTVTSKKTPLGMRYTAVRTNIEVIASDDTKSAVSGLYGSEFVITSATSPISDRQQVRLADENG